MRIENSGNAKTMPIENVQRGKACRLRDAIEGDKPEKDTFLIVLAAQNSMNCVAAVNVETGEKCMIPSYAAVEPLLDAIVCLEGLPG